MNEPSNDDRHIVEYTSGVRIGDGDRAKIFILNGQSMITRQSYQWVLAELSKPIDVRLMGGTNVSET